MLTITDTGEKIITEALADYNNAADEMRPCCARTLVAKLETVIALAKEAEEPLRKIIFGQDGVSIEEYSSPMPVEMKQPEEGTSKTRPMSPEDVANVDIVVNKKTGKKKAEKENDFTKTKKLMKAGKNLKEIAEETGKTLMEAQADVRRVQEQEAK